MAAMAVMEVKMAVMAEACAAGMLEARLEVDATAVAIARVMRMPKQAAAHRIR